MGYAQHAVPGVALTEHIMKRSGAFTGKGSGARCSSLVGMRRASVNVRPPRHRIGWMRRNTLEAVTANDIDIVGYRMKPGRSSKLAVLYPYVFNCLEIAL